MGGDFSGFVYGWFVVGLAAGAFSGVFILVAPKQFLDIQRRLLVGIGFPTEHLEPAWKRLPMRLLAAAHMLVCIAGLYYLLEVNPDFFKS